jgi:hypothetical protein
MNQGEPLSATMTPYFCIATATIRACFGSFATLTLALSRSRKPMGGNEVLLLSDA